MSPNNLAPGFVTIDDACALIKSDTRDVPVVDMDYLIAHKVWIEPDHNFRIPKIRMLKEEEIRRTKRGKTIYQEVIGEVNVAVRTLYDAELLKKTIEDKYYEEMGHEYKKTSVIARSTVADDAQGESAVRPRNNPNPVTKEGETVQSGTFQSSNGEGIL